MKKVILHNLKLSYFKGIKQLDVNFEPGQNFVFGKNEAGKTTLFDALWFLFFGKDSNGRAEFSIKTLNENNEVIEKVDHEVSGLFSINGVAREFRRVYKEIWNKSKDTLKGHTTDYWIDGLPCSSEGEYKAEIKQLFTEEVFKLLTNPLFFNSMKPMDRREILIGLAPALTDQDIFGAVPHKIREMQGFKDLEKFLSEDKDLGRIKMKAGLDKKKYTEEKDEIKPGIKELERSKPEVLNFDELIEMIEEKKAEIKAIESEIKETENEAANKNKVLTEWQDKINSLKRTLTNLEFEAQQKLDQAKRDQGKDGIQIKSKIESLNNEKRDLTTEITRINNRVESFKSQVKTLDRLIESDKADQDKLRGQWNEENAREFSWDGKSCAACNRPFEGDQAAQLEEKARALFNGEKANNLKDIESKGKRIGEKIGSNQKEIEQINDQIQAKEKEALEVLKKRDQVNEDIINLESALNEFNSTPQEGLSISQFLSSEASTIKGQIEGLENEKPTEIKVDTEELELKKSEANKELETLQKALGKREEIQKIDNRIKELNEREKFLADKISEIEGLEFAALEYTKAKIGLIEETINSKFKLVRFKMFEELRNGNEREICETLFKGVPWQDVNTAGKTQSGLDIIRVLSDHYEAYLPIFIDNRESVHEVPEVESQIINLVAKDGQNKLLFKSEAENSVISA